MRFEISTDPSYYGSDVTADEATAAADIIAERLGAMFPEVYFEIVSGAPREDYMVGEEDAVDAIRAEIDAHWTDWVSA
jgi:hypothetical protein